MLCRLLVFGFLGALLLPSVWAEQVEKQGKVFLYYGREDVGEESYRLISDGDRYTLEGRGRLHKPITLRTEAMKIVMDRRFNPQSFEFRGQIADLMQTITVEFKDQRAHFKVSAPHHPSHIATADVHDGTLVAPNGIMFPLILLERTYAKAKTKAQTQYVFVVPSKELDSKLTYVGPQSLDLNRGPVTLDHFKLGEPPFVLDLFFDAQQRLALATTPSGVEAYFNDYDRSPAEKARLLKFTEEEVSFGLEDWPLKGYLTLPRNRPGKFPAVVLLHEFGAFDRDESVGRNYPFRDIAHHLSDYGFAVLRFDKRAFLHYPKLQRMMSRMGLDMEIIDDAVEAVKLVAAHPKIQSDRIFLLGHGLGGIAAPWIAKRSPAPIAGIIVLAAHLRPVDERLAGEIAVDMKADKAAPDAIAEELARLRRDFKTVRDGSAPDDKLVFQAPAHYWRDLLARDPRTELATRPIPLLVLQGEKDYQVTMADFKLWQDWTLANRRADTDLKSFPTLNHFFMPVDGESDGKEYHRPSYVSGEPLAYVVRWLEKYSKPKS